MEIAITVTEGPARGRRFVFDEPDFFLFGRSRDARVSLPDDGYVSRQHFLLAIAPPHARITDLGSKNGTIVNGVRYGGRTSLGPGIKPAPAGHLETELCDGDEIVVGDSKLSIAIAPDSYCAECHVLIASNQRAACAAGDGVFVCADCREQIRRANRRLADTISKVYELSCSRCQRDVTAEAGDAGQISGAEYVCRACRRQAVSSPMPDVCGPDAAPPSSFVAAKPASSPARLAIPGYLIEDELGRGGMGSVYKAIQQQTGRAVAIKTMLPHVALHADHVQLFLREVDINRQLRHPHIVEVLDYGKHAGTLYCVMEYVDGLDLDRLLRERGGWLHMSEAAPLMLQILDGLGHAHSAPVRVDLPGVLQRTVAGVVHRDLKPHNILVRAQGDLWVPKIADFGLSKAFESAGLSDITRHGEIAGTPIYWPREQITQYRYLDPATDVFSIAAVFYEMLTGVLIRDSFAGMIEKCRARNRPPGIADYAGAIFGNPAVPIRDRDPRVPEGVAAVIDRALREIDVSSDPATMRTQLADLRYPDAGAFRDAMISALHVDCPQWISLYKRSL